MALEAIDDGGNKSTSRDTGAGPDGATSTNDKEQGLTQAEANEQRQTGRKPMTFHLAFLSLLIMVLLTSLDATILAVAIPPITSELNGTAVEAFWASICFTLAVVIVQPIYTSVSNVLGRKITLYAAFVLFGVGSIVFAAAHSMGVLIFGRVLQGLGGGGLDVLSEIILVDITTLKERALWIGLLSIPMAVGCIIGPILGAVFSEYAGWRWIGWINLPLIGIALVLAIFFLRLKPLNKSFLSRLATLDWIGMTLFAIGSTAIALPLSWGGVLYSWRSWRTIVPLALGAVVMLAFAVYERRPDEAVFPYRIFKTRTAQVALVGAFIHGMVLYSVLQYLPIFFQAVYLVTPLQSAVSILPVCVTVIVFTGVGPGVVEYLRSYRWEIWLGWIFLSVGTGLFALWKVSYSDTTRRAATAGFQIISGIGLGTAFTVPTIPMQASAKAADQGLAIGIMVSFRLFGALIGLAIGSAAFNNGFARAIANVGPLPGVLSQLTDPNKAISFIPRLRDTDISDDLMFAIRKAYSTPFRDIWIILAAFGGLGFVGSLLLEDLTLETEELGDQHYEY